MSCKTEINLELLKVKMRMCNPSGSNNIKEAAKGWFSST